VMRGGGKVMSNCKVFPDTRWCWYMGSGRSGGASGLGKKASVVRILLLGTSCNSEKYLFMRNNGRVARSLARAHVVTFLTYTPIRKILDFAYVMSFSNVHSTLQTSSAVTL
jgi:hypothetical protein